MHKIAIVDDHNLVRSGLVEMVNKMNQCTVVFDADNGHSLLAYLENNELPNVILLDINLPIIDGYEIAKQIRKKYYNARILALSMLDEEHVIIRMLVNGANGYLHKNAKPLELMEAIECLVKYEYYYNNYVTSKMIHNVQTGNLKEQTNYQLTDREIEYLKYTCLEKTHKEIGEILKVSPKTVEYYRDSISEKINIKTKVGMVLFAVKSQIFPI
jgi:two-component system, NarL family, invasion response regulator UvrY